VVDLLDNTSDDSLVPTSDLARPAVPRAAAPRGSLGPEATGPGFGALRGRRGGPESVSESPPRAPTSAQPPLPPRVAPTGLPPLPSLPGRIGQTSPPGAAAPQGAGAATQRPLPPLPPLPGGTLAPSGATSKPLPPLPPALRTSRPAGALSEPSTLQSRPSMPATPPALQRSGPLPAPGGGAIPSGVIDDLGGEVELKSILERYTQALEEGNEGSDVLIAQFVQRYGARRPVRPVETLMGTLDLQMDRVGPGLARLVLGLVRHLAERGLVDLAELLAECGEDQNLPPRQT
jgi:hypothetical protein